jgi:hypothetical protein
MRVYDSAGNVIETDERGAISRSGEQTCHPAAFSRKLRL